MTEPDDKALQDYLARNSEISERYREAATETTPAALDARILRAAHRELRPSRRRWLLPLSMAAAVVLSVSVLLRLPAHNTTPMLAAPAPAVGNLKAESTPTAQAKARSAISADAHADADADAAKEFATDKKAAAPAYSAPSREREAAPVAAPNLQTEAQSRADAPAPSLAAPAATGMISDDARAASGNAMPMPQPARKDERPMAPAAAEKSEPAAATNAEKSTDAVGAAAQPSLTPEAWIIHIRKLRADGDAAAANAELRALRARYPDYVLPPDLRE